MIRYENGTQQVINADTAEEKPKSFAMDPKRPTFGIYVDPFGFLLGGPMIGPEFTYGKLNIQLHARFPSLGFSFNYLTGYEEVTSGYGIGIGLKYFEPGRIGGFYVGGMVEFGGFEGNNIGNGYYAEMTEKATTTVFGMNIGYKFVLKSGLYFRTGVYVGMVMSNFDRTYIHGTYEDKSYKVNNFIFIDDLAIGFNF
jgi:hypothetical protein